MNKEKILAELKTRLGKTAVSDKTLESYSAVVQAGIVEEKTIDEDFWQPHISALRSMEGQINHDAAAAVQKFKASLQGGEGKKVEDVEDTSSKIEEKLQEMSAALESLTAEREAEKQLSHAKELKSTLLGKSKELNIRETAIWEDVISDMQVKQDMDADSFLSAVKSKYEEKVARYRGEGVKPYGSDGGGQEPMEVSASVLAARRKAYQSQAAKRLNIADDAS